MGWRLVVRFCNGWLRLGYFLFFFDFYEGGGRDRRRFFEVEASEKLSREIDESVHMGGRSERFDFYEFCSLYS